MSYRYLVLLAGAALSVLLSLGGPAEAQYACSANSVKNITASNVTVIEPCTAPGDTGTLRLDLGFSFTGQAKYDFALAAVDTTGTVGDGTLDNTECLGEIVNGNTAPFANIDGHSDCYDLNSGVYSFTNISVPFACPVNAGGGGATSFTPQLIFGWNGGGDFNVSCSYLAGVTSIPVGSRITLSKTTTDTSSTGTTTGSFDFSTTNTSASSTTLATAAAGTPVSTELWITGPVSGATHASEVTISEAPEAGWDLTSMSCTDGSGTVGSYDPGTGTITLPSGTIPLGSTLSCSYVNNARPTTATLTLEKVVSGGAASAGDFTLTATGPTTLSGTSGVSGAVAPGTYVLSETSVANYTGAVVCTGAADPDPGDGLTLVAGETVSCTFTNTYTPGVPSFTVTKTQTSGGDPVLAPGTIGWTITVENTGPVALLAPVATDTLSQGGTALTPGATLSGPTGDANGNGALDPGEIWSYAASYAVTQDEIDDGGDLLNQFSFDPANAAAQTASETTAITQSPNLTIVKTHTLSADSNGNGQADAGDVITYTYTVTNSGNTTLSNVRLNENHTGAGVAPIPGNETLSADAAPPGDSTDAAGGDGIWSTLRPGDTVQFTATYTVVQADLDLLQ